MDFKDYYQALGVEQQATADEIKKAFRKQARKYHPDVSKEPDAETRMKEINEANAVLSDPEKRAAYDKLQQGYHAGQDFRPPPDWDAGFEFSDSGRAGSEAEFSDFFSQLFGDRTGRAGARGRTHHQSHKGEDHHAKVLLDLEDAYGGASRSLTLRSPRIDESGRVAMIDHTLNVSIPKGVHEGQVIRLTGQGGTAPDGMQPGDLYLEVHFKSHSRYRVEDRDVYAALPIAPWEAALGASVKAPLPDGVVEVRVPEGSQAGRKLRLKGRGIPGSGQSSIAGDLYLVLEIVLPPTASEKTRELYRTMAREMAFNPRQDLGV